MPDSPVDFRTGAPPRLRLAPVATTAPATRRVVHAAPTRDRATQRAEWREGGARRALSGSHACAPLLRLGRSEVARVDRRICVSLCFHRRRLPRKCESVRVPRDRRNDREHRPGRRVRRDAGEARRPRKDVGGRAHADVGFCPRAPAARRKKLLGYKRHVSEDREAGARRLGGIAPRRPVEHRRAGFTRPRRRWGGT
jgi:hypothetical protein